MTRRKATASDRAGAARANAADNPHDRQERQRSFVSLADPKMKPQVDQLRRELSSSPDKAREFLQKAGILNRSGNLKKNFVG